MPSAQPLSLPRPCRSLLWFWFALLLLSAGCATHGDRVAPIPTPDSQQSRIEVAGAKLMAVAYQDAQRAKRAFGFDARGAGLLPVMLVIDNQSGGDVAIAGSQTFLVDTQAQAWPLLSTEQANQRVRAHVEVGETVSGAGKPALLLGGAGALAGAAIGVVTGGDVAESAAKGAAIGAATGALGGGADRYRRLDREVREGMSRRNLSNQRIRPGELGYGFLFFPGKDEVRSVDHLRLALEIGGQRHIVRVPVALASRDE